MNAQCSTAAALPTRKPHGFRMYGEKGGRIHLNQKGQVLANEMPPSVIRYGEYPLFLTVPESGPVWILLCTVPILQSTEDLKVPEKKEGDRRRAEYFFVCKGQEHT